MRTVRSLVMACPTRMRPWMSTATSACTCMYGTELHGQLSSTAAVAPMLMQPWYRESASHNLRCWADWLPYHVPDNGRQDMHRDRALSTHDGTMALCSAPTQAHLRQRRSIGQVARADAGEARAEIRDALHLRHHAVQQHRARAVHDAHPAATRVKVHG